MAECQVEVRTLAGHLGWIDASAQSPACDLIATIHSQYPPPVGSLWRLAIEDEVLSCDEKILCLSTGTVISCAALVPTDTEQECVVQRWIELHCQAGAFEIKDRLVWAALQSIIFDDELGDDRRQPPSGLLTMELPSGLRNLQFGWHFNQPLDKVVLPSGLQSLTFGYCFNQPMEKVHLPSGLQSLTFADKFDQPMQNVALPSGLLKLIFGDDFNQPMENVVLPSGLESLSFTWGFNHPLDNVVLPGGLKSLTFGEEFDQTMQNIVFPSGLDQLSLHRRYDSQKLENLTLSSFCTLCLYRQDDSDVSD